MSLSETQMDHLQDRDYDYDLLLSKTAKTTLKEAYLRKTCFTFFGVDLDDTKEALRAYSKCILRRSVRRG